MRSHSKDTAERMLAARPGALLDFIEIGSMTEPGAFDAALSGGIDGVIHCASVGIPSPTTLPQMTDPRVAVPFGLHRQ
jgi:hypothetical protein